MITKEQKIKFVDTSVGYFKKYKNIGVIQLDKIPDRLLQKSRNELKDTKFILGRKNLLNIILEKAEKSKLSKYLVATSAIVLSNDEPSELYAKLKANKLKLSAKPKQNAPQDIEIKSGETSLQPGKSVTELKQAGIDVQIQKGKVVIAKDKVIKKGELITVGMSKALQPLGIKPFTAYITPVGILSGNLFFSDSVLSMTPEKLKEDMARAFVEALQLSRTAHIINNYTIRDMIGEAYLNAITLGIDCNIYEKGITEKLIEKAIANAKALSTE